MPELSDDERAFLDAFRRVHTPSEAATSAALAEVQERLAAGEVVAGVDEAEPAAAPPRFRPLVVLGVAAVAIAAAVLLAARLDITTMLASEEAGGAPEEAVYAEQDSGDVDGEAVARAPRARSERPVEAKMEEPAAEVPEVEEPEAEEPTVEELAVEVPLVEPPPARRRPRPAPRAPEEPEAEEPSPPAADATLHAEIALLRPAQKALRSGDHARALRLLDDHAKSFPRSVLAPERSLGRIQALCGLGRKTEARQQIEAFGRAHPGSPLAGRVKTACPQ